MQSKINTFFKSSSFAFDSLTKSPDRASNSENGDELEVWESKEHQFCHTYTRRPRNPNNVEKAELERSEISSEVESDDENSPKPITVVKNKKRSYAQFHLEFGQSDFVLRTCSTCGIKYVAGDVTDEKIHKSFHKDYTHGIQFKGWSNERVVSLPNIESGRIVMVLDSDSHAHKNKVGEVVKMMEIELGSGWIFNKLCKVYMFILSQRIIGCAVAEPIEKAFKVVSISSNRTSNDATNTKAKRAGPNKLQFGAISFQREVVRRTPIDINSTKHSQEDFKSAIFCEKDAMHAVCGIRAIWVSPAYRRKGIATKLLDAVRKSFCSEYSIDHSQLAFSQPTLAGKSLASKYICGESFLVYKSEQM